MKLTTQNRRVAVGLSGGVDSSVAAALLVDQGYEVTGVYITCWPPSAKASVGAGLVSGCRSEEDRQDALDIALQLGIPFVHLDFQKEYKEKVYEYMISEYKAGRTPNPDMVCNKEIKFGLFYDWAMKEGYDFIATGHYAQIGHCDKYSGFCSPRLPAASAGSVPYGRGQVCGLKNQNICLLRSKDEHKDQTYFLYLLRQEQLEHVLFPVGHLTKKEVREEAERRRLLSAAKPDSQGICFIGEVNVSKFLEERIEKKEGDIVIQTTRPPQSTCSTPCRNGGVRPLRPGTGLRASLGSDSSSSMVIGKHRGAWFYTIGQRIRIDDVKTLQLVGFDTTKLPHFYVISKDMKNNILYVGTDDALFRDEIQIQDLHWIGEKSASQPGSKSVSLLVRIRHGGELVSVREINTILPDGLTITLAEPVRAVAAGQAAVLYDGVACVGGGIITEIIGY